MIARIVVSLQDMFNESAMSQKRISDFFLKPAPPDPAKRPRQTPEPCVPATGQQQAAERPAGPHPPSPVLPGASQEAIYHSNHHRITIFLPGSSAVRTSVVPARPPGSESGSGWSTLRSVMALCVVCAGQLSKASWSGQTPTVCFWKYLSRHPSALSLPCADWKHGCAIPWSRKDSRIWPLWMRIVTSLMNAMFRPCLENSSAGQLREGPLLEKCESPLERKLFFFWMLFL